MRDLLKSLLLLPMVVYGQEQTSQGLVDSGLKKYNLEKGSITYSLTGDSQGQEIFVFDRHGWRSMRKSTMQFELYGIERSQVLHEISDGSANYRINHADSTYQKRTDTRWIRQAEKVTPRQASEAILFGLGGIYRSDSVLLGKTCQVWTFESKSLKQMWIWEGLVLKRISKLGENNIITTASKINLEPAIDEIIFKLPEIYQLKE